MGERAIRFAPNGDDFVDVCPLCQGTALEHGWVKEGSPTTPTVPSQRRRRRRGLASLFEPRRRTFDDPVVSEPILRRLSEPELQMVEASDIFNASDYRRTVGGIAKSLGEPRASIVPLSGVTGELVVTEDCANLIGDSLNAWLRHDPKTLIGVPIGGLMIWYLSRLRR